MEWIVLGLALAATGLVAGLLAGLLGIGGGLVFVPALLWLFRAQGVPPELAMHMAVGSSLASIVLTSSSATLAHARRRNIDGTVYRHMLPGLLLGGLAGAFMASTLSAILLQRVFGVFLLLVALQLFFGLKPDPERRLPGAVGGALVGGGIGTLAAMLGIGGGTLAVPFFVWCRMPVLRAIGTASAVGLPFALTGAIGFAWVGWGMPGLPPQTLGYIAWPAVLVLGLTSMGVASWGAQLAARAPAMVLRRLFGAVLVGVGIRMLV